MAGHAPQQTPPDRSVLPAPKRAVCNRCRRPQRVCLCAALPAHPIRLAGHVVVLQHPHETKLKLATVPILQQCLSPESLTVIVGRRLKCGEHPAVEHALQCHVQHNTPILLLWPGPGATCITDAVAGLKQQQPLQRSTPATQQQQQQQSTHAQQQQQRQSTPAQQQQQQSTPAQQQQQQSTPVQQQQQQFTPAQQQQQRSTLARRQQPVATYLQQQQEQWSMTTQQQEIMQAHQHSDHQSHPLLQAPPSQADLASPPPAYVLLVVDSTWRYAREMVDALSWIRQPRGPAVQVTLPGIAAAGCAAASSITNSNSSNSSNKSSTNDHSTCSSSSSYVVPNGVGSFCCSAGLGDCTDVPACISCSLRYSQPQHQRLDEQHHISKSPRKHQTQQCCHNSCTGTGAAAACDAELGEPQGDTQQQSHLQHMQPDQPAEQQQQTVQQQPQQRLRSQQPCQLAPGVHSAPVAVADRLARCCSDLNGSSSSMGSPSCTVESNVMRCPSLPGVSCRLRTEPHESCCTTYEAVARAASCLEGPELLPLLLQPLQLLTALQAQFDPAVRQRMQQGSSGVVSTKSKLGMRNKLEAMKL